MGRSNCINIHIVGNGLSSAIFLYLIVKKFKEKVKFNKTICINMDFDKLRIDKYVSFCLLNEIDNILTPKSNGMKLLTRLSDMCEELDKCKEIYAFKIYNDRNIKLEKKRISYVNGYDGVSFINILNDSFNYCKNNVTKTNFLSNNCLYFINNNFYQSAKVSYYKLFDYVIYTEPLTHLLYDLEIDGIKEFYTLRNFPIGFSILKANDKDLKNCIKEGVDREVIYDIDLRNFYFRKTIDVKTKTKVLEYSLAYSPNLNRVYTGGIMYPGQIIASDAVKDFKDIIDEKFKYKLFLLGRYAEWNPNIHAHEIYNESNDIIDKILS